MLKLIEKNPLILLFIQPVFMASNLVVARGAVDFLPPISLAFWRWVLAFLILFAFTFREIFKKKKYIRKELFNLFFLGLTSAGICGAFPFIAGTTTTVLNMGIIYSSSPIFIVLFSYIVFQINLNFKQIIGFILSLFGVLYITCNGSFQVIQSLDFNSGDFWILGASISWALYSVYQIKFKTEFTIFARVTLISFFGILSLMPFLLIEDLFFFEPVLNKKAVLWVIFAAISPSIIAFFLYANLQERVGANIAGLVVYLYPVYGSIYGYFIFSEQFEIYHAVGAMLVLLGIYFCKNFKKKNE